MNPQHSNQQPQLVSQFVHMVNLPSDNTSVEIQKWFPQGAIDNIDIFPMPPKPGCQTTVIKQATARWLLESPQEPYYKSFKSQAPLI